MQNSTETQMQTRRSTKRKIYRNTLTTCLRSLACSSVWWRCSMFACALLEYTRKTNNCHILSGTCARRRPKPIECPKRESAQSSANNPTPKPPARKRLECKWDATTSMASIRCGVSRDVVYQIGEQGHGRSALNGMLELTCCVLNLVNKFFC